MSTSEVIAAAEAVIEEQRLLADKVVAAINTLREQRAAIDAALEALGADEPAPAKKRTRKTRSDKGQQKRPKEVAPQTTPTSDS
jgi:hypothetical protein